MSRSRSDKKFSYLESNFQDILVCKKNDCRPYMEIFMERPEHIEEQNLGTIAGILEITDESEDSSYIVNYLISIIKKEYFSHIKRGALESFEAALHKVNLALAKLAQHGNINWVGKFNAIVLAIEKNNIHLARVGQARAFMLRRKILTDIAESAPEAVEPNPLKTFIDVLSGRLENGDKLIIATESIFDIFSFEEIKRSAIKFSSPEFIQFLKTALGNELEKAMALVIEVQEKTKEAPKPAEKNKAKLNAFSQETFSKAPRKNLNSEEKQALAKELKDEAKKSQKEFTDQKTGHIYIREDQFPERESWRERLKKLPLMLFRSQERRERAIIAQAEEKLLGQPEERLLENKASLKKRAGEKVRALAKIFFSFIKNLLPKVYPALAKIFSMLYNLASKIAPRFSQLKNSVSRLNYSQKIYAALAVILLIVVPYFIVKIQNRNQNNAPVSSEVAAPIFVPLEQDKNVSVITELNSVYSGSGLSGVINLRDKFFAVSQTGITALENNQSYPLPENFVPVRIAGMDDLNLIFMLGEDGKLMNWSPLAGKFQENQITLPENSTVTSIKTYLTYLYVLDSKNNQIYRYPRAEGGFGTRANWLKDNVDLTQAKDLAISDNVYLAEESQIIKLYQGRKQDFTVETTATPIMADEVYTKRNSQNIYIMDRANERIIKLDLNGAIISQYWNAEIKNATDFTVDETQNLIYFSTAESVKSFGMN